MSYISVDELRVWLGYQGAQVGDDPLLEQATVVASAAIDDHCGRTFTVPAEDAEPSVRLFPAAGLTRVLIDDAVSVETVEVSDDRVSWTEVASGDWWLLPDNNDVAGLPFTSVGSSGSLGVVCRVEGVWGWPSLPWQVRQACLLKAARLFKRRESPAGFESGFGEFGVVRVSRFEDADLVMLLGSLRRVDRTVGVA